MREGGGEGKSMSNQIMKKVKPMSTSKAFLMAHPTRAIASMVQEIPKDRELREGK